MPLSERLFLGTLVITILAILWVAGTHAAQQSRPPIWTAKCFKFVSGFVDEMNRLRPDQTVQVKTLVDQDAFVDKYCMVYPR